MRKGLSPFIRKKDGKYYKLILHHQKPIVKFGPKAVYDLNAIKIVSRKTHGWVHYFGKPWGVQ